MDFVPDCRRRSECIDSNAGKDGEDRQTNDWNDSLVNVVASSSYSSTRGGWHHCSEQAVSGFCPRRFV